MIKIKVKEKPLFKRKRDNYARKLKRHELINYLQRELASSTTHGLPYIVNTEIHWFERLFWAVSFVFCGGLAFALLSSQYKRFIETPTVISVEMDYFQWNVSYPAFTLCPYFKPDSLAWNDILNETYEKTERDLEAYLYSIVQCNMDTLDLMDINHPDDLPYVKPKDYAALTAGIFKRFGNSSITTNSNWPISVEPVMTEVGMCHSINSNVAKYDNPIKWSNSVTPGPYVKTNIELSVHDRDYYSQVMNYADVYKIFIHSPDETILSTTPSYTQSDKGFLSFGVQVWSTKISEELRGLPLNIRKCRFINEPISERYPIYSYNHCMLECKIKMILKLCGCIPHFYKPLDHERVCNMGELNCIIKHKKEIMTLTASEKSLNIDNAENLPKSIRDCNCWSSCETEIYLKDFETFLRQADMSRLRIGISAFPKVRYVRDVIFSLYDIILRSGGLLNLCIGTSIISLMELIVTVVRLAIYNLNHLIKRIHLYLVQKYK